MFNVPLVYFVEQNRNTLENTFLPMWAATSEMMSRINFPGNHPESGSCDAYRFDLAKAPLCKTDRPVLGATNHLVPYHFHYQGYLSTQNNK